MKIVDLDIPEPVKEVIIESGITKLYPPQIEALKAGALEGNNLVLASPTASGKTLIAELCAMKHVIHGKGKVLYLTPLRALASEKYEEFKKYERIKKEDGRQIKVAISTGDYDSSDPWLERYDIIVTTNEKADSLLRHRAHWIGDVSLVVADEVHLLSSVERGPTLEVVLARLRHINPKSQILALSATIRNAGEIAKWLGATPITTNWRPVKLKEGVYLLGNVKFNDGTSYDVKEVCKEPSVSMAADIVKREGQALVFAETRRKTVSLAKKISTAIKKLLPKESLRHLEALADDVLKIGERTRISELLAELIKKGVAFHHAGLNPDHRKMIEDSFREGTLKVTVATPTLAFGVNLPARLVIIHDYKRYVPGYWFYPIPVLEYKQMSGRAGRPRYDKIGESVLIARTPDELDYLMENYVYAEPENLWSRLGVGSILRSHVLATIASGFAYSEKGVLDFFNKTFYAFQYGLSEIEATIGNILKFLQEEDMIRILKTGRIVATRFGSRVSELYIDPVSAVIIRDAFAKRATSLSDLSFLHLICHTPDLSPKFYPSRKEIDGLYTYLDEHIDEFMVPVPDEYKDADAFEEFLAELKMARVLESWINEISEDMIIERYGVESGDLFRVVSNADWLLYASYELARLLNHRDLMPTLFKLRERVEKGIKEELLPLARLEGIGRVRARMLYNANFKTIGDLKRAAISELMKVPLIGAKLARSIKEQVGGLVTKEEWEKLKAKEELEQKLLTQY